MLVPTYDEETDENGIEFIAYHDERWNLEVPIELEEVSTQDLSYVTMFKDMVHAVWNLENAVIGDLVHVAEMPGRYVIVGMVKCWAKLFIGICFFVRWLLLPRIFRESTSY
jgi:hypothetical protein